MNTSAFSPQDVLNTVKNNPARVILPIVICVVLAVGYGVIRPRYYEASQALVVRDAAIGKHDQVGKFNSLDEMKAAQETVMEIAGSEAVAAASLASLSPGYKPTKSDVKELQERISVKPPKGAEFGKTEVFYLHVESTTPERSAELASAIGEQLENRLRFLREQQAKSLVNELEHTVRVAQQDLDAATAKLAAAEKSVGSDLNELRLLAVLGSGSSSLRQSLIQVETELRQAETHKRNLQQLRDIVVAAKADPTHLVATPNMLLETQPSLKRLKDGLLDAQLETARLQGSMSSRHPRVLAAIAAEQEIRRHLHSELDTAIVGIHADLTLADSKLEKLQSRNGQITSRLGEVAGVRAEYTNLTSEVEQAADTLHQAQEKLADARATLSATSTASLLTRLDNPVSDEDPTGSSTATIAAAGFGGGMMIAAALIFLSIPTTEASQAGETAAQPAAQQTAPQITGREIFRPVGTGLSSALVWAHAKVNQPRN